MKITVMLICFIYIQLATTTVCGCKFIRVNTLNGIKRAASRTINTLQVSQQKKQKQSVIIPIIST